MRKVNVLEWVGKMLSLLVVASLVACGGDDEEMNSMTEQNPIVNTYTFSSAIFKSSTVILINNPADQTQTIPAPFKVGDNGTDFLSGSINGSASCDKDVEIGIELRNDGTTHFVCNGGGTGKQQGTWVISSDNSTLTLRINDLATDVILKPWKLTTKELTGTALIPLPYDSSVDPATGKQNIETGTGILTDASSALLATGGLTIAAGTPNIHTVEMEIKFDVADF